MNKIIAFICCLMLTQAALAQKDSLAFDDHGKYIYYKVVNMDKYTADTLYSRSLRFVEAGKAKKDFKLTAKDAQNTAITGSGFFTISKPSLAKHPDGQIAYTFKLEIKGSKYRYWLTDFVYTPYFRDRYNNYVPEKGVDIPLEAKSTKITEKELALYVDQTAAFSRQLGDRLKAYLETDNKPGVKKEETKKVIHIDKW